MIDSLVQGRTWWISLMDLHSNANHLFWCSFLLWCICIVGSGDIVIMHGLKHSGAVYWRVDPLSGDINAYQEKLQVYWHDHDSSIWVKANFYLFRVAITTAMPWFTHIWDVNLEISISWQWTSTIVPYDLNQDASSTTNNESRHDHVWIYRVIVDIWPWVRCCRWMISLSGCFNDSVKLQHTSSPSKVSTWWLVEYPYTLCHLPMHCTVDCPDIWLYNFQQREIQLCTMTYRFGAMPITIILTMTIMHHSYHHLPHIVYIIGVSKS